MEKRIFKNTPVTQEELSTVAIADLLEAFNARLTADGAQPIAKFSDKKSALRRTWACLTVAEETEAPKTVAEIKADLEDKTKEAQAKFLPAPPAEIIIDKEGTEAVEKVAKEVGGTPITPPAPASGPVMVFCGLCGRSVPVNTTFMLPSAQGDKFYCKKDPACRKPNGKKINLKEQAQIASAKVKEAKAPKAKAEKKGPNPNIGKFDNQPLSAKENKRANSESVRSAVYNHIVANPGCTIKDMEKDGVALLPVLRDCVKKLFADLKIEISGWEVVTPRTLNFREVK